MSLINRLIDKLDYKQGLKPAIMQLREILVQNEVEKAAAAAPLVFRRTFTNAEILNIGAAEANHEVLIPDSAVAADEYVFISKCVFSYSYGGTAYTSTGALRILANNFVALTNSNKLLAADASLLDATNDVIYNAIFPSTNIGNEEGFVYAGSGVALNCTSFVLAGGHVDSTITVEFNYELRKI